MVPNERPGNGAPGQRTQDKGEKWHQRRVCNHASRERQVFHRGGGEECGAYVEGAGQLRPASSPPRERRARHVTRSRDAPGACWARQAAGTSCRQSVGSP